MTRPACLCETREWTLPAVAEYLRISVDRLKHLLVEVGPLVPTRYRRIGRHPRRHRVLTTADVVVLLGVRWGLVSLTDGAPGRNAVADPWDCDPARRRSRRGPGR